MPRRNYAKIADNLDLHEMPITKQCPSCQRYYLTPGFTFERHYYAHGCTGARDWFKRQERTGIAPQPRWRGGGG